MKSIRGVIAGRESARRRPRVRLIHSLCAAIAFGAFTINAALAERTAPQRSAIASSTKKGIVAKQLEQVRKGVPPNLFEHPGKSLAASPLERPKKGIAPPAMGHRDAHVQAIGGPARNAIGLPTKNEPTVGAKGLGTRTTGARSTSVPNLNIAHTGHPSPDRAAILRPLAPAFRVTASAPVANASQAPTGNTGGAISGTGIIHIGSGPAVLGGPTVKRPGMNGTSLRPKH